MAWRIVWRRVEHLKDLLTYGWLSWLLRRFREGVEEEFFVLELWMVEGKRTSTVRCSGSHSWLENAGEYSSQVKLISLRLQPLSSDKNDTNRPQQTNGDRELRNASQKPSCCVTERREFRSVTYNLIICTVLKVYSDLTILLLIKMLYSMGAVWSLGSFASFDLKSSWLGCSPHWSLWVKSPLKDPLRSQYPQRITYI